MTESQIALINKSFGAVLPIREAAADIFYKRLFELNPKVRPMFPADLKEQGRKLMHTIGTAVGAARNLESLRGPLQELAKRHTKYGVKIEYFDDVGNALIYTLEKGLGPHFTDEQRHAWLALYTEIVQIMIPAMRSVGAAGQASVEQAGPSRHVRQAKAQPRSLMNILFGWIGGRA